MSRDFNFWIIRTELRTLTAEEIMKRILIGAVVGMMTAVALQAPNGKKCFRKAKKAVLNKIEDVLD